MVCLFLLPVIAKITTDCLILIGCWKVSLNLIGCLKKLSRRTKCNTSLDLGSSGLYVGAFKLKSLCPFFWTHFISWQSVWSQKYGNDYLIESNTCWIFDCLLCRWWHLLRGFIKSILLLDTKDILGVTLRIRLWEDGYMNPSYVLRTYLGTPCEAPRLHFQHRFDNWWCRWSTVDWYFASPEKLSWWFN